MKVAVLLGYPAILADRALYWFGRPKDRATELAHQLSELLGVRLIITAYMPPIERAALAAWAIRTIDREREAKEVDLEHWWALEDCRINCWNEQRRAYAAADT